MHDHLFGSGSGCRSGAGSRGLEAIRFLGAGGQILAIHQAINWWEARFCLPQPPLPQPCLPQPCRDGKAVGRGEKKEKREEEEKDKNH